MPGITHNAALQASSTSARALHAGVRALENADHLDPLTARATAIARRVGASPAGAHLRGNWLGHAFHPLLTDFPLGCWIGAGFLDLLGGRRARPAATRLVGLGVLASVPTAAAGLAEFDLLGRREARRVAFVHAALNTIAAILYACSWRLRRRGRHRQGVSFGMAGAAAGWITGYLGGHLSLVYGAGHGPRGLEPATADAADDDDAVAAVRAGGRVVGDDPLLVEGPNPR